LVVEGIWDSIAAQHEAVPATPAQKRELDRRLSSAESSPDEGGSWGEVKGGIQGGR
jgi:putative addiction module component (TIGR02574 family)